MDEEIEKALQQVKPMRDDYKRLDTPAGYTLKPCWCCGADAELWQHSEPYGATATAQAGHAADQAKPIKDSP